jgi:hypothetical protein
MYASVWPIGLPVGTEPAFAGTASTFSKVAKVAVSVGP